MASSSQQSPHPRMRATRCYLYVLPGFHEDIVKLGISHDPLARVRAFASRYYESFDLARSLLVAFDTRAEAQARETRLHRQLRQWNAVQPTTIPRRAAGHTEWYRGAYLRLAEEVDADRGLGHVVHAPAHGWWRDRLCEERDTLYEWSSQHWDAMSLDADPAVVWRNMVDVLDAWPAMGLSLDDVMPPEVARKYAGHRAAFAASLTA